MSTEMRTRHILPAALLAITASATIPIFSNPLIVQTMSTTQITKGRIETLDLGNFRLHVYYTNDAMGDISYIVEGPDGLVTLEQPLFRDNIAEFNAYEATLGKPVAQRIADYHLGGTDDHALLMPEGMHAFTQGEIYGGIMKNFAGLFGDAITAMPTGQVSEVAFDTPVTYAGIPFRFVRGASTDFPAASILIGDKVYYSHWAPAQAHVNVLQVGSPAAIDAEIAAAEQSLKTGATHFIGSHGAAVATAADVRFKIDYLKKLKELRAANPTPEALATALRNAYPGLPGEDGVEALAKAMYP